MKEKPSLAFENFVQELNRQNEIAPLQATKRNLEELNEIKMNSHVGNDFYEYLCK